MIREFQSSIYDCFCHKKKLKKLNKKMERATARERPYH